MNRLEAMRGPRFEQTSMDFQPMPLPAIELIKEEPIRVSDTRVAHCDGGMCPSFSFPFKTLAAKTSPL